MRQFNLAAVKQTGYAIEHINKGITPSEALQLAAIERSGLAIEYIINKGRVSGTISCCTK